MKRTMMVVVGVLIVALTAAAQEMPRVEIFGGYSYLNVPASGQEKGFGLNGWNAQGSVNINNWLGVTADFGGTYGSPFSVSLHNYSYMFGPTLSYRATRIVPFAHALFGGSHLSSSIGGLSASENVFAMAVGGGVDVPLVRHFGVRLAQVDWMRTQYFNTTQNNLRVSTGAMLRF